MIQKSGLSCFQKSFRNHITAKAPQNSTWLDSEKASDLHNKQRKKKKKTTFNLKPFYSLIKK